MAKAKKSLGQNWLKSESAIREIIKAADLSYSAANFVKASLAKKASQDENNFVVLEIGPGRGVLTRALLETGAQVIAIEKDDNLIDFLQEKFASEIKNGKLVLIHDDILNLNFSSFLNLQAKTHQLPAINYKLVANIPYYITGQVIRKFLSEEERQPSRMVLMVQKEVARRIVGSLPNAHDRKHLVMQESLLSISVKVYGEPKYIKTVPAGAFDPKPNVDSAILLIENISRDFFLSTSLETSKNISEEKFFEILKKGFSQKRKLLKSNLGVGEDVLPACNILIKARAENLNLENWRCLIGQLG